MTLLFWETFGHMPAWVTVFWAMILTGSYWILRLLMQGITVWICRCKRVSIVDGRSVDGPISQEDKE